MKASRALLPALALAARLGAASPPAWSLNQPIYEVNLEMFSAEGNYRALKERLPALKALGVGILWLTPITERGRLKAFGSPYCVRDYRGLHAPFGSAAELKGLVNAAHAQGMRLILDWVGNHTAWDHPWITAHPEYYARDRQGRILQAHEWSDVAQLDYSSRPMRAEMIEAMKYWLRAFDVDGFRCDVAWGIPAEFWAAARRELDSVKPVFLLAESDSPADAAAFDADYAWSLMNSGKANLMTDVAQGRRPASEIGRMLRREARSFSPPFMRLRFTSNHDEWKDNGTPFERLGPA
jgi:glycosidase